MVSYTNLGPPDCICTHEHKHHTHAPHTYAYKHACNIHIHKKIFKVKTCKHWSSLRQSTKVVHPGLSLVVRWVLSSCSQRWWFTEEVHRSSPLMGFLEVVRGGPSCLLTSHSLAHPHTLCFSKLDVYPLCCVFTLPFLGTVLKTVIGSDRSVPRTNGYTKEPRCVVCCVVWVCVDTRCVMFPQHTTTERILNVRLHDDMQILRYVLFKSLLISKYIHILA